jgi:hypothetical protein
MMLLVLVPLMAEKEVKPGVLALTLRLGPLDVGPPCCRKREAVEALLVFAAGPSFDPLPLLLDVRVSVGEEAPLPLL